MATIGYARISTKHQQLDSQLYVLEKFGCTKIFMETESGRNPNRSKLAQAIDLLKSGDTFVIFKLDRLSRGTKFLLELMEYFKSKDINFVSLQDNIDTNTPMGRFFFTIMGAFAEMEAELIRERVLAGLDAAKNKGLILGRPPVNKNIDLVIHLYLTTHIPITEIAKRAAVSRPTVYRYLKHKHIPLNEARGLKTNTHQLT